MLSIKSLLTDLLSLTKSNNNIYKWTGSVPVSTSETSCSVTITTKGRPVYLSCTGDFNPAAAGNWMYARLYRGSTLLTQQVLVGTAASYNTSFGVAYLDQVSAGTYTYYFKALCGSGSGSLSENNDGSGKQTPQLIVMEI